MFEFQIRVLGARKRVLIWCVAFVGHVGRGKKNQARFLLWDLVSPSAIHSLRLWYAPNWTL
jgi:hypothetical protein